MSKQDQQSAETKIALMANDIGYIKAALDDLKTQLQNMGEQYVTKIEYLAWQKEIEGKVDPINSGVIKMVAIIMTGILGLILAHVFGIKI